MINNKRKKLKIKKYKLMNHIYKDKLKNNNQNLIFQH